MQVAAIYLVTYCDITQPELAPIWKKKKKKKNGRVKNRVKIRGKTSVSLKINGDRKSCPQTSGLPFRGAVNLSSQLIPVQLVRVYVRVSAVVKIKARVETSLKF